MDHPITRREALKKGLRLSGSFAIGCAAGWPGFAPSKGWALKQEEGFLIEGVGQPPGYSVRELTQKVFDAAGGMRRFVSKGDVVVIKPNISWARPPNLAAGTNPEVLEAVIKLAFDRCRHGCRKDRRRPDTPPVIPDAGYEASGPPSGCMAGVCPPD
ncbi:MAG: hypothetical protein JRL30_29530 [Deltaproteobacteria bacterium]|nr:hypothetical protein [Deltaproteobacteria bacterium]